MTIRGATIVDRLPLPALGMLAMRSWFGVNYVLSPTSLPNKAGFDRGELTPSARFFASVFAMREFLMVAMVARAATAERSLLRDALVASAAVDAFDAASATALAAAGTRSKKGAVMSAVTAAMSGSLAGLAARRV